MGAINDSKNNQNIDMGIKINKMNYLNEYPPRSSLSMNSKVNILKTEDPKFFRKSPRVNILRE